MAEKTIPDAMDELGTAIKRFGEAFGGKPVAEKPKQPIRSVSVSLWALVVISVFFMFLIWIWAGFFRWVF